MGEGPEAVRLRAFVLFARFARERDFICGPAGRSAFLSYFFIYLIFAASGGERE